MLLLIGIGGGGAARHHDQMPFEFGDSWPGRESFAASREGRAVSISGLISFAGGEEGFPGLDGDLASCISEQLVVVVPVVVMVVGDA